MNDVVKVAVDPKKPPAARLSPFEYEYLWAIDRGQGQAIVDNIPFFARRLNYKDLVAIEAFRTEKAEFVIRRVLEPSGHATFHVVLTEGKESLAWLQQAFALLLRGLKELGCGWERSNGWLYAIDVPPDPQLRLSVLGILEEGSREGKWEYDESGSDCD
jgi:hypothetical protein